MDLDDLLGDDTGSSTKKPDLGFDDMDDLLGGPSADTNILDDDLLFGDGPSTNAPAAQPAASAPPPGQAPARMEAPKVTSSLNIPQLEAPPGLKPFVAANEPRPTYYARFVLQVFGDMSRDRRVVTITDQDIVIYDENCKKIRVIEIQRLFGIIMQPRPMPKRFGASKDLESHVLLQIDGDADLWFVGTTDSNNGNIRSMLSVDNVLSAIIGSWGLNLPVAILRPVGSAVGGEDLSTLVRWQATPDVKVRHQLTETLAFRSELMNEIDAAKKRSNHMDIQIMQLRSSAEGQQASTLTQDIASLEETVSTFQSKMGALQARKASVQEELKKATAAIAEEEKKRDQTIKDKVRGDEQEALMRRAKEFELMKAAHKRDLEKVTFLTGLYEQRVRNRGQDVYSGVHIGIRIEELEEELETITGHISNQQASYQNVVKALGEVRKRIATARELQERLEADIAVLKEKGLDGELPEGLVRTELPDIGPVEIDSGSAKPVTPPPQAQPAQQSPPPAAAPAAAKAPITLDSDDDI